MEKTFVGANFVGKAAAAAALWLGMAGGCGADPPEDNGVARLAITQAPADVLCVRITVVGSSRTVTRAVDVTPGQSTELTIGGLPLGSDTFSGEAFSVSCAALTPAEVPSWVGDPVTADVAVSPPVDVALVLRRNGRANIGVDFQDDGTGGMGGTGGTGGMGGTGGTGGGTGGTSASITFEPPRIASLPAPAGAMAAGQFTSNFNSDLVVATIAPSNQLLLLQGMGGGFGLPRTLFSFGDPVSQVLSADLNGDSIGDLVVSFTTSAPVVMLGTGTGQFNVFPQLNVPPATALALLDVDADGLVDIVSASRAPDALFVSRNNGGGMFQTIQSTASPAFTQLAGGFLDGDTLTDLIGCDANGLVSIAHGVVPGLFGSPQFVVTLPAPANALGLVDVNGDGAVDAVFATSAGLLLLDGATETLQTVLPMPSEGLVVTDLNGDGLPDVSTLTGAVITVLRNTGAALLVDGMVQTSVSAPTLLAAAELNGTFRPELVVASSMAPVLASLLNTTP